MPEVPWDEPLVQLALTHPSFVSEGSGQEDNQRLEFLGDAVLGLAIGQTLFRQLPTDQEGPLSRLRSRLVSREMLAEMGEQLNLAERLKVGHGERLIDPAARQRALTDAFEALIGALFLIWGYLPTQAWVLEVMQEPVEAAVSGEDDGRDPKSMLQEALQHRGMSPIYDVLESIGPAHRRRYRVVVKAGGKVLGRGEGRTKKVAEQDAAKDALEQLAKPDQAKRRRTVIKPRQAPAKPAPILPQPEGARETGATAETIESAPSAVSGRRRSRRPPKAAPAVVVVIAPSASGAEEAGAEATPVPATRRRRRRGGAKAKGAPTAAAAALVVAPGDAGESRETPAVAAPSASGKRRRRRSKAKQAGSAAEASVGQAPRPPTAPAAPSTAAAPAPAAPRRRRSRGRRPAAAGDLGVGSGFVPKSPPPSAVDAQRAPAQADEGLLAPSAQAGPTAKKRRRHRGGRRRHKAPSNLAPLGTASESSEAENWQPDHLEDD